MKIDLETPIPPRMMKKIYVRGKMPTGGRANNLLSLDGNVE